jgi:hypothetical protein
MKKSKETLVLVGGPRTGKTASLVAKAAKEDAYISVNQIKPPR